MFSVSLVGLSADALSRTAVLRCSGRLGPSGAVGTGADGALCLGPSHCRPGLPSPAMGFPADRIRRWGLKLQASRASIGSSGDDE
ncbi:unnamed protein product [Boreogadus saida]